MGIKCSIVGHRWGARTVEREREEQGSEVVSTEREIQTCQRCGDRRVVSENTEVTTLEPAGGDDAGAPAASEQQADPGAVAGSARGDHADGATDAEVLDEGPAAEPAQSEDATPAAPSSGAADSTGEADAAADASETGAGTADDGVILDEEEPAGRKPGEWPQDADEAAESEWARDASGGSAGPDDDEYDTGGPTVTVPEGSFHCPECGFSTDVEASSLRAGDFCPECQQGSLEQTAAEE